MTGELVTRSPSTVEHDIPNRIGKRGSAAILALTAAAAVWSVRDLELRTDPTELVPESDDAALAAIARQVADSDAARTIVLSLGPFDDARDAAAMASEMGDALRSSEHVAWVQSGPPRDVEPAFYEIYFPRRLAFLAGDAEELATVLSDDGLRARVRELRDELAGPSAVLVRRIAQADPLLAFPRLLTSMQASAARSRSGAGLEVIDGAFVARPEEGRSTFYGIVFLASRGTAFRAEDQEPVLAAIDAAFQRVRASRPPSVRLEQAGVARFAVRAERGLRADTERISLVSSILIVGLFLALFRSARFLVLGAIPLAVGSTCSLLACRIAFGSVHAITLAFGSSLLGVGIDFIAHYVSHHVLEPREHPEATMRALRPGLVLGAATTIAGLAGLSAAPAPGMRELALFASAGVTGSLAATLWLVPPWMPSNSAPTGLHLRLARAQERMLEAMRRRAGLAFLVPVGAMVVCAWGLPALRITDDVRRMTEVDPELVAEDRLVRARVGQGEAGRFVISIGDDDEAALWIHERVERTLREALGAGEIGGFRSVGTMLRSARSQREVESALRRDATLQRRLLAILEEEGFVASLFEPFFAALREPSPPPLTYQELVSSPVGPLVRPFRLEVSGPDGIQRVAYLTFVQDVRDPDALARRLESTGARFFDQARYLEAAYRTFRERALSLVAGGLLLVLAMCSLRYRSLRAGLASVVPAALAALSSLALVALSGREANLMHLVACLLVLSMGEDYAVFLLEHRDERAASGATMTGIFLACVTTVASFGLLAWSTHPALNALGVVTATGVGLAFVLAPLAPVVVDVGRGHGKCAAPSGRP